MWDKAKSIAYLDSHALDKSSQNCAKYTRLAIEEGGLHITPVAEAKDYGPSLIAAGFRALPTNMCFVFQAGDVAVIQAIEGDMPSGHMCMFDGTLWVSDFKQTGPSSPYSGPISRKKQPDYVIYRYPS